MDKKYETKYFGEIMFYDFEDFFSAYVKLNDTSISILISDKNTYNKINTCLNMIDRYFEINDIAKNAILKNYSKNKILKNYFKYCFNNFDEEIRISIFGVDQYKNIDLRNVIERLEYPNLVFKLNKKKALIITPFYILSRACFEGESNILCVNINEQFNVINFEHGVVLVD